MVRMHDKRGGRGRDMEICIWHGHVHVHMGYGIVRLRRSILSRLARRLASKSSLLEGAPFEVLFITSTLYVALRALLTGGFRLVALESLRFTGYTAIATFGLFPFGDSVGIGELCVVLFLGWLVGTTAGWFFCGGVGMVV